MVDGGGEASPLCGLKGQVPIGASNSADPMTKQVQHKSSKLSDEGVVPGCWWGLFHSFGIHQRAHHRKSLGQQRLSGKSHATGIKVQKVKTYLPPTGDEDHITEQEKNTALQVEDRHSSANASKAQTRAVTGQGVLKQKGMAKQKVQKQKVKPFATQLSRTNSIHHMECDDYVCSGEMPDNSKIQESQHFPHNSGSSARNEHLPLSPKRTSEVNQDKRCDVCGMPSGAGKNVGHKQFDVLGYRLAENQELLQEKIWEAKKRLLEQETVDGKGVLRDVALGHSKDFLETLELFNVNRELLLKILHEQNAAIANYLQGQEGSKTGRTLAKSGSFPSAGFSGRTVGPFELKRWRDVNAPLKNQERKSKTESSHALLGVDSTDADKAQAIVDTSTPVSNVHGVHGTASNSEWASSSTHVMNTQKDNGTAVYCFKDIKQRIKDIIKENNKERHRISMDGVLHRIPYGCQASQEKPSPWEVSVTGKNNGDGSRNSFGSGGSFPAYRNANNQMRRSQSLSESVDRYSYLLESNIGKEPKRQISDRLKIVPEDSAFQVTNSPRVYARMLSLPEFDSYFLGKGDQSEASRDFTHSSSISVGLVQESAFIHTDVTDEQKMPDIFESSLEHAKENNASPANGSPERSMLGNIIYAVSDDLETKNVPSTYSNEQDVVSHVEWSDKLANPGPISSLDSYLSDDLVSPAELSVLPDSSELMPKQVHFEQLEHFDSPKHQSEIISDVAKTNAPDANEVQNPGMQVDFGTPLVPVDNMHEFHFVMDVLKKYLFDGNEDFARWNAPCHPSNTSISEEAEGLAYELEPASRDSEIKLDHDLLFDLTNEVILEIYETSYGHLPWLSHSCCRVRPTPMGHHLLEEVWANISWYLKSHSQSNDDLEYIIRQDFRKNDRWMNLHCDIETIQLDLEALIIDDLLDEAIIECVNLARQQ